MSKMCHTIIALSFSPPALVIHLPHLRCHLVPCKPSQRCRFTMQPSRKQHPLGHPSYICRPNDTCGGLAIAGTLCAPMASSSTVFASAALVLLLLLGGTSAQLSTSFYSSSCPKLFSTVKPVVRSAISKEKRLGASVLRLFFHDCFVLVILPCPHNISCVSFFFARHVYVSCTHVYTYSGVRWVGAAG